jgi:hypothetical protein
MMEPDGVDDALQRLRQALHDLATEDARELLQEVRAHAREDVRALLTRAMRESMLSVIEAELRGPDTLPPPRPRAVYVYGVVSAGNDLGELPAGVDGSGRVRGVAESGLTALVSDVDGAEFAEARLREHMADLAWVQDAARRHEAVIEAIGTQRTVIPMRMCTVYSTEGDIRDLLRRESRGLREALRYLDGKTEWGVKVFSAPYPADGVGAGLDGAATHDRAARVDAAQRADDAAKHVHEVLCAVATDSLLVSPQEYEGRDGAGELLLNGVYLVGDDAQQGFRDQALVLAQALAPLELDIEVTGPWPAYNFVPGTIGAAW